MADINILYMHSHDTGRYIQPYGHAIPTPNLQELAETGVLFRQAFCAAPTCSPSRACLVTGQYAHSNGMFGLAHRGFSMSDYSHHILHTLRKAGYHSTLAGVQHIAKDASVIGYDQILGPKKKAGAEQLAEEFLKGSPEQPFFLSVGFIQTHRKFPEPGSAEDVHHCIPPAPLPDTPETRKDMASFKASARILDEKMGIVLKALEASGLAENTLVICTTDHGIAFPRMKCNLTDGGTGVMLMMRGPGGFTGGRAIDGMVSHVDIFPTVCDLLGIERPDHLQGVSVMPLVRGETEEVREEIFSEVNYHASYEPQRCVRTRRWKYIRRFGGRRAVVLPNCDDSPSKTVWLDHGWADMEYAEEELYDVIFDPGETNNLTGKPSSAEALEEMRNRLQCWMKETGDPLPDEEIPAPPDAVVNDPDGTSPSDRPRPVSEAKTS